MSYVAYEEKKYIVSTSKKVFTDWVVYATSKDEAKNIVKRDVIEEVDLKEEFDQIHEDIKIIQVKLYDHF